MQPKLKLFDQQTDRIKLEAAVERHTLAQLHAVRKHRRKLERLEAKRTALSEEDYQTELAALEAKRKKELDQIGHLLQRDYFKLNTPYQQYNDYEPIAGLDLEQARWHLDNLHPTREAPLQTGLVPNARMMPKPSFSSRTIAFDQYLRDLPQIAAMMGDTYLASADFTSLSVYNPIAREKVRGRQKECVTKTHSLILDIDYRERPAYSGLPLADLIAKMRADGMFDPLEPSYFISTSQGAGMYIVYLLEAPFEVWGAPFRERMERIARYEAVLKDRLIPAFAPYGADERCSDITRVYRLPNTYNKKSNTWTYIHDFEAVREAPRRYAFETLEALARQLYQPPEKPQPTEAEPAAPTPREEPPAAQPTPQEEVPADFVPATMEPITAPISGETAALAAGRCHDLETLVVLRGGRMQGKRAVLLHIYASQYRLIARDEADLAQRLASLNSMFCHPLEETELTHARDSTNYQYKDSTIIGRLSITWDELAHFQRIGHADPEKKKVTDRERKRRKRRNQDGVLFSALSRAERDQKIFQLHQQGKTYRQITQTLGCSLGTISKTIQRGAA